MSKPEVVARILTWVGPRHMSVPFDGLCARTFTEFPIENEYHGYWKEGEPLIRLTDHEADRAADKARIAELESEVARLEEIEWLYNDLKD